MVKISLPTPKRTTNMLQMGPKKVIFTISPERQTERKNALNWSQTSDFQ